MNPEELNALIETQAEIPSMENDDFVRRWKDVRFSVPVELIDMSKVYFVLKEGTDLLETGNDPLQETDELRVILGDLTEVFIDYLNSSRKSVAVQALSTFLSTGYVGIELDSDEQLRYTRTDKIATDRVNEAIEKAIAIYERF